jgi:hypothetical protein
MIDTKTKAIVYGSLIAVCTGFFLLLSIGVLTPIIKRQMQERKILEQKAAQEKANADSAFKMAEEAMHDVEIKLKQDSIAYIKEKIKIKTRYIEKQNQLDALYNSIDTISDYSNFGTFSVREMLSDSAVQLQR